MKPRGLGPALSILLLACSAKAAAQQLDVRFSCSVTHDEDGEKVIYADNGEIHLRGSRIDGFQWESALYRRTHGFDCSIDQTDGLTAEAREDASKASWRIALSDARAARDRRGYTFDRSLNCTIRLERDGNLLQVKPTCPALCGSRSNFSELSIDLETGNCRHQQ